MLHPIKHRTTLVSILKDIYSDPELRTLLGFKGGTAAMLFYDLPRLSVDLDFDLLDENKKELVTNKMKEILEQYGRITEQADKLNTVLLIVNYEKDHHAIKVDISKRKGISQFEHRQYLGVNALVMRKEDMIAGKLSALLTRNKPAMRDVFDTHYFLTNRWTINEDVLLKETGFSLQKAIDEAVRYLHTVKSNAVLTGLGELLTSEKQKAWVRNHLINETIFELRLYREMQGQTKQEVSTGNNAIPVIDITPTISGSGGSKGHFHQFEAINIGEKVAIDLKWGIRGFGYEWRSPNIYTLRPGDIQMLEYKISDEPIFKPGGEVPELNIFFEYKDNRGITYFSRRELKLERTPSGVFNKITGIGEFHPAEKLVEQGIEYVDKLSRTMDGVQVLFYVIENGDKKQVKIGMSGTLLALFGFREDSTKSIAALKELGQRKIKHMKEKGKLADYTFTSEDLVDNTIGGFEAYKQLRDSI